MPVIDGSYTSALKRQLAAEKARVVELPPAVVPTGWRGAYGVDYSGTIYVREYQVQHGPVWSTFCTLDDVPDRGALEYYAEARREHVRQAEAALERVNS